MNSIHYLDSLVVYTDAIHCICTQWDATYFIASIKTNFSRKLNLIDSCHITCHMLASQQVKIGLKPCSHLIYDRGSRRLAQWWPICTTCLAAQLQLRLWLSPPSHTGCLILELCSSRVYPSPHLSWPSCVRPAGPSLTLPSHSSSWRRP